MVRKIFIVVPLIVLFIFQSCSKEKQLLVRNTVNGYDSLLLIIKINDKVVMNGFVKKSSSPDYFTTKIKLDSSLCWINVIIPALHISKKSYAKSNDFRFIIITVDNIFSDKKYDSLMRINPNNLKNVSLLEPHISIAFFKDKFGTVY